MADVKPIPEGYHSLTPYLVINGAAEAIEVFTRRRLARSSCFAMPHGDKIGHAEMKIGDSPFMLADASEQFKGVKDYGGTP
jgi:PhnB protein